MQHDKTSPRGPSATHPANKDCESTIDTRLVGHFWWAPGSFVASVEALAERTHLNYDATPMKTRPMQAVVPKDAWKRTNTLGARDLSEGSLAEPTTIVLLVRE